MLSTTSTPSTLTCADLLQRLYVAHRAEGQQPMERLLPPEALEKLSVNVQVNAAKWSQPEALHALAHIQRWVKTECNLDWNWNAMAVVVLSLKLRRPQWQPEDLLSVPLAEVPTILQEPIELRKSLEGIKSLLDTVSPGATVPSPQGGAGNCPYWNNEQKALSHQSKSYRYNSLTRAHAQVTLLRTCQNSKWKNSIKNPFGTAKELRQTIRSMRDTLGALGLTFDVDGNECLVWRPSNPQN
jgi:hypothetical protein